MHESYTISVWVIKSFKEKEERNERWNFNNKEEN